MLSRYKSEPDWRILWMPCFSPPKKISLSAKPGVKATEGGWVDRQQMQQRPPKAHNKGQKAMTQDECLALLRKCVEKAPIPPIQKKTLTNITKVSYTQGPLQWSWTFLCADFSRIKNIFVTVGATRPTAVLPISYGGFVSRSQRPLWERTEAGNCWHDGPTAWEWMARGKSGVKTKCSVMILCCRSQRAQSAVHNICFDFQASPMAQGIQKEPTENFDQPARAASCVKAKSQHLQRPSEYNLGQLWQLWVGYFDLIKITTT